MQRNDYCRRCRSKFFTRGLKEIFRKKIWLFLMKWYFCVRCHNFAMQCYIVFKRTTIFFLIVFFTIIFTVNKFLKKLFLCSTNITYFTRFKQIYYWSSRIKKHCANCKHAYTVEDIIKYIWWCGIYFSCSIQIFIIINNSQYYACRMFANNSLTTETWNYTLWLYWLEFFYCGIYLYHFSNKLLSRIFEINLNNNGFRSFLVE